ncbi:hypothetical protein [Acerihabitans arboris]|uniref:Uncharacterized protein n=1 Tax=Acerihabitans arboris TaxID=2691583 RepID=A0A845STW6_9GAMM|nr:hypothetical protein [Acerihabitans arboris]NDL65911.1 hypothetical protein [Acerihabitans arboris]
MKKLIIAIITLALSLPFASLSYAHAGDDHHPEKTHKTHRHHRVVKHHVKKPAPHNAEPHVGSNR